MANNLAGKKFEEEFLGVEQVSTWKRVPENGKFGWNFSEGK